MPERMPQAQTRVPGQQAGQTPQEPKQQAGPKRQAALMPPALPQEAAVRVP